jgi:hypothetical protein
MIVAILICLCACNMDSGGTTTKETFCGVTLSISTKALEASDTRSIKYSYRAVPTWHQGSVIAGEKTNWTELNLDGESEIYLGTFTCGTWQFFIRGISSNSGLTVCEGSSGNVTLAKNEETVGVTAQSTTGAYGSVKVQVRSHKVALQGTYLRCTFRNIVDGVLGDEIDVSESITSADLGNGSILHSGLLEGMAQGIYVFSMQVCNTVTDDVISGEAISVLVAGDEVVTISGEILGSGAVGAVFVIDALTTLDGEIIADEETRPGVPITLVWSAEKKIYEKAQYWVWTIDGSVTETSSASLTWTPMEQGDHSVTCVAVGSKNGEVGNSHVTVRVLQGV